MSRTRAWAVGLVIAGLTLAALFALMGMILSYDSPQESPAYQPGIELDVDTDRTKTRPPIKQAQPKPAAPKPRSKS